MQAKRMELVLRAAPLTLCIAAMAIMLQNKQTNEYGALHYSNIAVFKYLVYANGICAAYSLVSAMDSAFFAGAHGLSRAWVLFVLDQVVIFTWSCNSGIGGWYWWLI
uniref:CASP-like protein n=1 Tax=Wollemia nobilis TaxID=56998 RepID=A0A0C9RWD8_9CONI